MKGRLPLGRGRVDELAAYDVEGEAFARPLLFVRPVAHVFTSLIRVECLRAREGPGGFDFASSVTDSLPGAC